MTFALSGNQQCDKGGCRASGQGSSRKLFFSTPTALVSAPALCFTEFRLSFVVNDINLEKKIFFFIIFVDDKKRKQKICCVTTCLCCFGELKVQCSWRWPEGKVFCFLGVRDPQKKPNGVANETQLNRKWSKFEFLLKISPKSSGRRKKCGKTVDCWCFCSFFHCSQVFLPFQGFQRQILHFTRLSSLFSVSFYPFYDFHSQFDVNLALLKASKTNFVHFSSLSGILIKIWPFTRFPSLLEVFLILLKALRAILGIFWVFMAPNVLLHTFFALSCLFWAVFPLSVPSWIIFGLEIDFLAIFALPVASWLCVKC